MTAPLPEPDEERPEEHIQALVVALNVHRLALPAASAAERNELGHVRERARPLRARGLELRPHVVENAARRLDAEHAAGGATPQSRPYSQ